MRRVQFSFDKRSWADLQQLKEEYQEITLAQTVRNAISLAKLINYWLLRGYRLQMRKGTEVKEIISPFLPKEQAGLED